MAFDFSYPTPLPSTKGWGPGWPNCQSEKMVTVPPFQGGVREELQELVNLLVVQAEKRGFTFHEGWSWGYGCRATKGGDGDVPSFHSWGLALDINAPENVFGGVESGSDIATKNRWLVPFLREYGFYWLGPSIGDWMHFSFVGSPADAKAMTEKAKKNFGDDEMTPEQVEKLKRSDARWNGVDAYIAQAETNPKADPPADKDPDFKSGWRFARAAFNRPRA